MRSAPYGPPSWESVHVGRRVVEVQRRRSGHAFSAEQRAGEFLGEGAIGARREQIGGSVNVNHWHDGSRGIVWPRALTERALRRESCFRTSGVRSSTAPP